MPELCPKPTLECGRTGESKPVIGVLFRRAVIAAAAGGLLAGCATLAPPEPAPAAPALYLVAHPASTVTRAEARDAWLGDAPAETAGPVPLASDNAPLQDEFLRKLLKLERAQYEKLWNRRAFRDGVQPPPRFRNDAEVNEYVRRTPGAVGYVRAPGSRVKVLGKL